MSFILEENGRHFCDWRFSLPHDCVDSDFFRGVQLFALVAIFLEIIVTTICLNLRYFGLKEGLKSFAFGANGALLFFGLALCLWLGQGFVVLYADNLVAGEITWAVIVPLPFIPVVVYLATLLQAFPDAFVSGDQQALKKMIISGQTRKVVMVSFLMVVVSLNIALHIAASVVKATGDLEVAGQIAQAATILFSVNIALFVSCFIYVSRHFLTMLRERLTSIRNGSKSGDKEIKDRAKIMEIVTKKIRTNINVSATNSLLLVFYHVMLSFYPAFFSNLAFSKAMSVIFTALLPSLTLPLVMVYLYVDIRRLRHKNRGSSSKHTTSQTHSKVTRALSKDKEQFSLSVVDDLETPQKPEGNEASDISSPHSQEEVMNDFLKGAGK